MPNPDEAVEAVMEAIAAEFGACANVTAEKVLAALPAGVYVSDGQGNVTLREPMRAGFAWWEEERWRLQSEIDRLRGRLAALSATDTEGTDD
jgi:hypothetical protein